MTKPLGRSNQRMVGVVTASNTSEPAANDVPEEQRMDLAERDATTKRVTTARPQRAVKTANAPEFQPWAGQDPSVGSQSAVGGVNFVPASRDAAIVGDMVSGMPQDTRELATERGRMTYVGGPDLNETGNDQAPPSIACTTWALRTTARPTTSRRPRRSVSNINRASRASGVTSHVVVLFSRHD